jgi:hypothetical protein
MLDESNAALQFVARRLLIDHNARTWTCHACNCRLNAELEAGRAADKASSAAVAVKGLEQQAEVARLEAAELREARLEAEAAHSQGRLQLAGLLVRRQGPAECRRLLCCCFKLRSRLRRHKRSEPFNNSSTLQAEVEGLKTAVAQEKHTREAAQKKSAELEASLRRWGTGNPCACVMQSHACDAGVACFGPTANGRLTPLFLPRLAA